jgi:carbonic anhydrase/acetyltransferase-like protein (isoleucine patch superfamily)
LTRPIASHRWASTLSAVNLGVPGKVVRELTDEEVGSISNNADDYVARSRDYAKHLKAE